MCLTHLPTTTMPRSTARLLLLLLPLLCVVLLLLYYFALSHTVASTQPPQNCRAAPALPWPTPAAACAAACPADSFWGPDAACRPLLDCVEIARDVTHRSLLASGGVKHIYRCEVEGKGSGSGGGNVVFLLRDRTVNVVFLPRNYLELLLRSLPQRTIPRLRRGVHGCQDYGRLWRRHGAAPTVLERTKRGATARILQGIGRSRYGGAWRVLVVVVVFVSQNGVPCSTTTVEAPTSILRRGPCHCLTGCKWPRCVQRPSRQIPEPRLFPRTCWRPLLFSTPARPVHGLCATPTRRKSCCRSLWSTSGAGCC